MSYLVDFHAGRCLSRRLVGEDGRDRIAQIGAEPVCREPRVVLKIHGFVDNEPWRRHCHLLARVVSLRQRQRQLEKEDRERGDVLAAAVLLDSAVQQVEYEAVGKPGMKQLPRVLNYYIGYIGT